MNNNTLKAAVGLSLSIMTSTLITLFLSGKIVAIPRGTHEGGMIAAAGVGVILLSMGIIIVALAKMTKA